MDDEYSEVLGEPLVSDGLPPRLPHSSRSAEVYEIINVMPDDAVEGGEEDGGRCHASCNDVLAGLAADRFEADMRSSRFRAGLLPTKHRAVLGLAVTMLAVCLAMAICPWYNQSVARSLTRRRVSSLMAVSHVSAKVAGACPWLEPTQAKDVLRCIDGTVCQGLSCCLKYGGKAKCPLNLPVMCRAKVCEGSDFCCDMDCTAYEGPRGCDAAAADGPPAEQSVASFAKAAQGASERAWAMLSESMPPMPPNECPWNSSTATEDMFECTDGRQCEGFDCCTEHGGRLRCPPNLPMMCKHKCEGNDYCCDGDCKFYGGPRPCPPGPVKPALKPSTTLTTTVTTLAPLFPTPPVASWMMPATTLTTTTTTLTTTATLTLTTTATLTATTTTTTTATATMTGSTKGSTSTRATTPAPVYGLTTTTTTTTTTTATMTGSTSTITTTTTLVGPLPSLFCFSMVSSAGYEPSLIEAQRQRNASLFGCNEHIVVTTSNYSPRGPRGLQQVIVIPASDAAIGDPASGATTSSFLNTATFVKAWDSIIADGRLWKHHWVVKVDPDAVFFPSRLRDLLRHLSPDDPSRTPAIFFPNCDRDFGYGSKATLFGSLEVFSVSAIGAYRDNAATCHELPWQEWGEDFYMQNCMDRIGVQRSAELVGKIGDKRCFDAPCTDNSKVAFHDFKDHGSWTSCWTQASSSLSS